MTSPRAEAEKRLHDVWNGWGALQWALDEIDRLTDDLIRSAVLSTRAKWPDVPDLGMVSFIDTSKVEPRPIRGRKTWGHSWFEAGFQHVGYTKGGLWVMQMTRAAIEDMPGHDGFDHCAGCQAAYQSRQDTNQPQPRREQ
jgi:hypothetical protein